MKIKTAICVFLILLFCSGIRAGPGVLEIVKPTVQSEANSIWQTINDINFLEEHRYRIRLPNHPIIDDMKNRSRMGKFGNDDYSSIYNLLEEDIFREEDYERALHKLESEKDGLEVKIGALLNSAKTWQWTFRVFPSYKVVLTLYGTGGSYNPETGVIILLTNRDGEFMTYDSPKNTIIHEIVHMGIEHSIIQKYSIPHSNKEHIVDSMTMLLFGDELPEYSHQRMGDPRLDNYLKDLSDVVNLEKSIQKFLDDKK